MAGLRIGLAVLVAMTLVPRQAAAEDAQAALAVEWSVEERFRLFDQADDDAAKARVEALLRQLGEAPETAPLRDRHEAFLDTLGHANGASLRRSHYGPPARAKVGSGRYAENYLYPDYYTLRVRLPAQPASGASCRWRDQVTSGSIPCSEDALIRIPGAGVQSTASWRVEAILHVSVDGGPERPTEPIVLHDRLIVALGDSYISGEGNPDVPSVVTDRRLRKFRHAAWGKKLKKKAGDYQRAIWWDEPCHRSLLSWPVLASLAYSARRPREAVTLVHLGCSGATVADILDRGEVELPGGGDEVPNEPQIVQLQNLLSAAPPDWQKRRPDRILLSVGGNDSGFVGVIKTLFLPPNGYWVPFLGPIAVGGFGEAICPYRKSGYPLATLCFTRRSSEERLDPDARKGLYAGYGRLASKLRATLGEQTAASERGPSRKIYHFIYPNPILNEDGVPCEIKATREPPSSDEMSGLEALMGIIPAPFRGVPYTWNFQLRYDGGQGCDLYPRRGDSEVCQALWVHSRLNEAVEKQRARWQVVTAHAEPIAKHGVCRYDWKFPRSHPRIVGGDWWGEWTPQSFKPYHKDNPRWFRTPNDSIVTQYGNPDHFHHGTVHPTFNAHLAYADAALAEAFDFAEPSP